MPVPPRRRIVHRSLAAMLLTGAAAALPAQPAGSSLQRLGWLQGCWRHEGQNRIAEEQWMAPRAGAMLGAARTVREGRMTEHEFVVLRELADGRIAYEVSPSGRPVTVFTSITLDDNGVIFENLQHDFPQRVAYQRRGDELAAWIEGPARNAPGQMRRIDFPYRKVECTSG